jgi:hypothetical protein
MVSGLAHGIEDLQCYVYTDWKRRTVDGNESVIACHGKIHTDIFNML